MPLEPASVVIPSWNGAAILRPTLEHLARLEGVEHEILVIDHGRLNRDTEALMTDLPSRFRYIGLDEQLGYAGAVNHGARLARHRLVAVICNDVLVDPDWLAELVRASSQAAVVTSLVTRPGFEPLLHRLNIFGRIVPSAPVAEYVPFFPDGSAFLYDKSRLGLPFDADYFLYLEDVSLGWRARLEGCEVRLAPASRAINADGGTTRRTPYRAAYYTERNRWLNYFSFLSRGSLLKLLPALLFDAAVRMIAGSNRRAKLHAWAWLLGHLPSTLHRRAEKQRKRAQSDDKILPLLSGRFLAGSSPANAVFRAYYRLVGLPLGD